MPIGMVNNELKIINITLNIYLKSVQNQYIPYKK